MANSYEAAHSTKLCGYPCVEYLIANTYELDPIADSHSCHSSVWCRSETFSTQLQSYEAPHSKKVWGNPYVEYPIANTYELDPMADGHSSVPQPY